MAGGRERKREPQKESDLHSPLEKKLFCEGIRIHSPAKIKKRSSDDDDEKKNDNRISQNPNRHPDSILKNLLEKNTSKTGGENAIAPTYFYCLEKQTPS